jgi:Skp family chaperone for outer membrane proteins
MSGLIHPSSTFTTGSLIKGSQDAPKAPPTTSESYVPAEFARQRISEIVTDMQNMRTEHATVVQRICDQYTDIEKQTQQHYHDFVKELQKKAKISLANHKSELRQARESLRECKEQTVAQIESLELSVSKKIEEKKSLLEQHEKEAAKTKEAYSHEMEQLRQQHTAEMSRKSKEGSDMLAEVSEVAKVKLDAELATRAATEQTLKEEQQRRENITSKFTNKEAELKRVREEEQQLTAEYACRIVMEKVLQHLEGASHEEELSAEKDSAQEVVQKLQQQLQADQAKFQQEIGMERSLKQKAEEEIEAKVKALADAEAKYADVQKALQDEQLLRDQRAMESANRALKQRMTKRKQEIEAAEMLQQVAKRVSVSGISTEAAPAAAVQQLSLTAASEKAQKEAAEARASDLKEEVNALKARLQARSAAVDETAGAAGGVAAGEEVRVLEAEVSEVRDKMKAMREEQQKQLAALQQQLLEANLAAAAPAASATEGINNVSNNASQSVLGLSRVQMTEQSMVEPEKTGAAPLDVSASVEVRQLQQEEASNDVLVAQELARQTVEVAEQTRASADAAAKEEEIKAAALEVAGNKAEKKDNKAKIKAWLAAFREKEGREPTNDDKNAIRPLYLEHKRMEDAMKKLETDLKASNQALAEMKAAAAAMVKENEQARA